MKTWYVIELFFLSETFREQGIDWLKEQGFRNCELLENREQEFHYGVRVYADSESSGQELVQKVQHKFSHLVKSCCSPYQEQDWMQNWRKEASSKELYPSIWVGPPECPPDFIKEKDKNKAENIWFPIAPRMVFGSGHHQTTALMVQAMVAYRPIFLEKSILDIGTGSGILCFVAKALGAKQAVGFDIDPLCVSNLYENEQENLKQCLSRKGDFYLGSLESIKTTWAPSVLLVNMIRTEAEPLIEQGFSRLSKNGVCIWSGLQEEDKPKVIKQIKHLGGTLHQEWFQDEWWCGAFLS